MSSRTCWPPLNSWRFSHRSSGSSRSIGSGLSAAGCPVDTAGCDAIGLMSGVCGTSGRRDGAEEKPQMRLLKCQVFEIFFGGARGGGKTDGVLGEFGAHASRYGKDAIGLMVRRTRAELVETIERSREIYGPLGWQLNETEKMWRAPDGARLRFAYLERDADADMYQGHNYTRVYVEEVGNFPSPAPVMKLMATLRSGAG